MSDKTPSQQPQDDFPDDADFPDDDFLDEDFEEDDFPEIPPEHSLSSEDIQNSLEAYPSEEKNHEVSNSEDTEENIAPPTNETTEDVPENNSPTETDAELAVAEGTDTDAQENLEETENIEIAPSPPTQEPPITSIKEIPFTVHVEIARLHIQYQTLCDLQSGQIIDLQSPVDNLVNLTVNGNIIGKGELVKVGDALGVRISQTS